MRDGATSMFDALCVLAVVGRSAESLKNVLQLGRGASVGCRTEVILFVSRPRDATLLLRAICVSRAKGAVEISDIETSVTGFIKRLGRARFLWDENPTIRFSALPIRSPR